MGNAFGMTLGSAAAAALAVTDMFAVIQPLCVFVAVFIGLTSIAAVVVAVYGR